MRCGCVVRAELRAVRGQLPRAAFCSPVDGGCVTQQIVGSLMCLPCELFASWVGAQVDGAERV